MNKRNNLRHPIEVPIRLIDADGNEHNALSGNVSDCGLYVTLAPRYRPALDSIVQVQVKTPLGDGSEPPINKALVVRHDDRGIGLRFMAGDEQPTET